MLKFNSTLNGLVKVHARAYFIGFYGYAAFVYQRCVR